MGKISISDLSIGDWVNIYHRGVKTSYRIKRIFPSEYDGVYMIRTHTNWDVNINGLMPIRITSDILEKLSNGCKRWHGYIINGIKVRPIGDGNYRVGTIRGVIYAKVQFIHELQHALRLAKVGKDIVL